MRQRTTFNTFGLNYRTREFAAVEAFDMLARVESITPQEMLKYTEVIDRQGSWVSLEESRNINDNVRDICGVLLPHEVLHALLSLVREYSFGFLDDWKPVKIPKRFLQDIEQHSLKTVNPIMGRLIAEQLASLNELQEYYSLKDAFEMYDIWANDGLNKALSSEASIKRAKEESRYKTSGA